MWNFIILIVMNLLAYALAPKAPKEKGPTLKDFEVPTADQGRPIPVIFGTNRITGPNIVWYGDLRTHTQTRDGVKNRRYYMGVHFALCHGPIDALTKIYGAEKEAWSGSQTTSGTIAIDAAGLYGGREKEGGIDGDLSVMMGEPTQTANTYLTSVLGTPQPAYRGVTTCVFEQGLIAANSPYVKPWAFDVQRIHNGWDSDTEWYPERTGVGGTGGTTGELVVDTWVAVRIVKDGLNLYLFVDGILNDSVTLSEEILGGTLTATSGGGTQLDGSLVLGRYRVQDALYPYSGHIDEFLFFRDVALSTANYTPDAAQISASHPNWANLEVCLHFNGVDGSTTFTDETGRSWSVISPAQIDTAESVFGGASGYFSTGGGGARSAIHTPFESSISFAGTWTIDLRMRPHTITTYGMIFCAYHINDFFPGYILLNRGDGRLEFYVGNHNYPSGDVHAIARLYQQPTDGDPPFAMNPAHIIYEALTNAAWGMGYGTSIIDDSAFRSAADTFYSENMGLCLQWTQQQPIEEFVQIICDHAGAVLRMHPATGLLQLKAIRGDYVVSELLTLDETNIVAVERFERAGFGELVGEVSVVWHNYLTNQDETTTVQNLAVIQAQSGVVSETVEYPGIPTVGLAQRVAMRDLKARSVPLARVTLKVNREAWNLLPGDVFLLSWTKLGLTEVVMRVGSVKAGTLTDGTITIEAVEDVFGLPDSTYAAEQSSGWTDPVTAPVTATEQTAIELPYWWLSDVLGTAETAALAAGDGYGLPLGVTPQAVSDGNETWVSLNAGTYAIAATDADWTETALLNGAITGATTSLVIDSSTLDEALVGDLLLLKDGATEEVVRLTGGDLVTGLTVTRGHLDTTPRAWADNARIWRLPVDQLLDDTRYTDTDVVDYKLLTTTSSGVLPIGSATAVSVTMDSRAVRPIPPGNFTINSTAFPTLVEGAITVGWAHRDRLAHLDTTLQTATGITTEASVTYSLYAYDDDTDTLLDTDTGLTGTSWSPGVTGSRNLRIEAEAVRDGYTSWQRQVRVFEWLETAGILDAEGAYLLGSEGSYIQEA